MRVILATAAITALILTVLGNSVPIILLMPFLAMLLLLVTIRPVDLSEGQTRVGAQGGGDQGGGVPSGG